MNKQVLQQGEHVAWKHSCNALCVDELELFIDSCPHCGKPRSAGAAPAAQPDARKVIEQMVVALRELTPTYAPQESASMRMGVAAIQAGQQWLEVNK